MRIIRRVSDANECYVGVCYFQLKYKVRGESYKKPGEGIVKVIEEERANLVVIGTRGIGSVKRALIGSVSEYVVRNANVPTLVIPFKKWS